MINTTIEMQLQQFCKSFYKNRYKYTHFVLRFVHNPDAVEDLVSDSFANLWEKRKNIPHNANIEAYFYIIMKNNCLNWLRNKEVEYSARNEMQSVSSRLLQYDIATLESYDPNLIFTNEIRNILQDQLHKMPALTCKVFTENRFNDMTYDDIARKYNISIWKVAREIHAAMTVLRVSLQDYLPVCFTLCWYYMP